MDTKTLSNSTNLKNKVAPVGANAEVHGNKSKVSSVGSSQTRSDESDKRHHKDAHGPQNIHLHDLNDSESVSSLEFDLELAGRKSHGANKEDHHKPHKSGKKKRLQNLIKWWRRFSAVLFSPIFLRHRNIFYIIMEILVPAVVAFIILAAFTSGISWTQNQQIRKEAQQKNLNFPEEKMDAAIKRFTNLYTDKSGRTLILFSPVTDFTVLIMQHTLEQLGLRENNRLFKDSDRTSAFGVIGMKTEMEMFEWAMYHYGERISHATPIGIRFQYDDDESNINPLTKLPYEVTFAICTYEDSISETREDYPFMEPPKNEKWQNPYLTSGFIGLQYAIEYSFIRIILEKQKVREVEELQRQLLGSESKGDQKGRSGSGRQQDFDEDLFAFLNAEVDETDEHAKSEGSARGRSTGSEEVHKGKPGGTHDASHPNMSMRSRTIKTVNELPKRSLKMFSYDMFGPESFRTLVTKAVTFSLVFSYCFMSFFIVKQISEENLSGIKDLLDMHGLPHHVHWIILFFHVLLFRGITSGLVLLALNLCKVAELSSNIVLYVLILIHEMSLSFMNFFVAIHVPAANMAGIVAVSVGFFSFYLPESFFQMKLLGQYNDFALTFIFPNWCLRHVLRCIIDHESSDKGITWRNMFEVLKTNNSVSVGGGIIRLSLVGAIYFIIACYVDMTTASKMYPPTYKWYQFKEKQRVKQESKDLHAKLLEDIEAGRSNNFDKPHVYENPKPDKKCYVHVRNISKTFGKHVVALDSINLNILHGEITVILGHTGSGKSTLVATIAGFIQPTTGYVLVKGLDVQFNLAKAREYIGFCPQKIVDFNLLTVREHVNLCYRLKGYNASDTNRHVSTLLTKLKLWNVRNFLPSNLKQDELRRLGIVMALADTPKILILDEPTNGMDWIGRRELWDIILQLKQRHTIIISTNYIDEAEHLADRIAFLAHGRLVCFGSLAYLRDQYDTGYFLRIEPMRFNDTTIRLDTNAILNFVRNRLNAPGVTIKRNTRIRDVDNLLLELPQKNKDQFPDLCEELESKLKDFNIEKYSIRGVNLNDIFIQLSSAVAAEGNAVDVYVRRDSAGDIKSVLTSEIPAPPPESEKIINHKYHFQALVKKRVVVFKSSNYHIVFHFIFPLIVIWMVVFQAKILVTSTSDNPERQLNTRAFNKEFKLFYRMGMDDRIVNFSGHLHTVLSPHGIELKKTDRVFTRLYEVINTDPEKIGYVKDEHMIAFEFRKLGTRNFDTYDFVGYFASGSLHSAPVALNAMSNVYLSALSASEGVGWDERRYRITVVNDPMPKVTEGKFEKGCGITCILLAMLTSFSVAYLSHSCLLLPMLERQNGMKHLQIMCGLHPAVYWLANFVVDLIVMFGLTLIIVLLFLADYFRTFWNPAVIFTLWFICMLYLMWSGLMYSYFMSSFIPTMFNGFNVLAVVHLFLGVMPMLWTASSPPEDANGIFWRNLWLVLFPPYTITSAFYSFFNSVAQRNVCRSQNTYYLKICEVFSDPHRHFLNKGHYRSEREQLMAMAYNDPRTNRCCDRSCLTSGTCFQPPNMFSSVNESWSSPGLIWATIALSLQGFMYWGFLILSEKKLVALLTQRIVLKFLEKKEKRVKEAPVTVSRKMRDVRHEALAVRSDLKEGSLPDDVALICVDLTKSSSSAMIIKNFCLEVKLGSCVGILGRGSSGKSCIARMIAGDLVPTTGNCHIDKSSLTQNSKYYLSRIGYCPQSSYLLPEFTATQMMELMGQLRGIPQNLLNTHVDKWLRVLGLHEIANDKCKTYGDGMKHRLSVALAFIGDPEIVLLDEPTTGIDALSRERLWAVIEHLHAEGRTIIFTTYSTDEAFTLAEKVAIIAEGGTQCIGSPQDLQKTYAKGHTITFKLRPKVLSSLEIQEVTEEKISEFKAHVLETYKHVDLLDEHDEILLFFLRDARFTWAEVYRRASYLATYHSLIIDSYEVCEGEIDDIFIFMTKKHQDLTKPRPSEPPAYSKLKEDTEADEGFTKHTTI